MSRVDDLIAEHCPAGVPFKTLGEVGRFVRGNGLQKKDFVDDGFPCIHYGQIYTHYGTSATVTKSFIAPDLAARLKQAETGDLVITTTSENIDDVCTAVAWLGEGPIAIGGHSCVFQHTLDPMYAAYYFQTEQFEVQKRKFVTGTKVKDIKISDIARVTIPVPPLVIQREIVAILDKLESLKTELEAELELRRAQRLAISNNFALSVGSAEEPANFQRVTLGSLARESMAPLKVQPEESYLSLGVKWNGEGVLVREPRPGNTIKATTLFRARSGQLIYNRMFVVEGSFAIVPPECDGAVVSGEFPLFDIDSSRVEPQWLLNHLCDPYTLKRIEREVTGTERGTMKSRRRWKSDQFADFEILLPTLQVQREVVAFLTASRDLIRSLEDEISARHKQYEHYRDKLLTFEELAA